MTDYENCISVDEDNRITVEEAAKTPEQVNAEALKLLYGYLDRLEKRVAELESRMARQGP